MVVKSFTFLNYFMNGKWKAREEENFTAAPPAELLCDCVLCLLLLLLGSAQRRGAPETGSECVQLPRPHPPSQWLPLTSTPHPARPSQLTCFCTGPPVRQGWRRTLRKRRAERPPGGLPSFLYQLLDDGEKKRKEKCTRGWVHQGYFIFLLLFLFVFFVSPRSQRGLFSTRHPGTPGLRRWFRWTASLKECTIDW